MKEGRLSKGLGAVGRVVRVSGRPWRSVRLYVVKFLRTGMSQISSVIRHGT
jgi:hypothetical protein